VPVSKTDARSGTLRGRYKALRRAWRDRKALKAHEKLLEDEARIVRIREFINRPGRKFDPQTKKLRYASRGAHARNVNLAEWLGEGNTYSEWCEHNGVSLTPPD
jgi:hypothetical protein